MEFHYGSAMCRRVAAVYPLMKAAVWAIAKQLAMTARLSADASL
jgi:hypothetical protein